MRRGAVLGSIPILLLTLSAGPGFGQAPAEISNLRFTDPTTLAWDPEPSVGVYNLYRDWLSALSGIGYGQCAQQDLIDETATDSDTPSPAGTGV